jgi:Zn finger protein HypA/HybF involved in hydrogenase expression
MSSDTCQSLENLLRPFSESPDRPPKHDNVNVKTLEAFHSQQLHKLREETNQLETFRAELAAKMAELHSMETQLNGLSFPNMNDIRVLTGRKRVEEEIKQLKDTIQKIEMGENEAEYFLRIGDILFSYSDAQDRIATGEKPVEVSSSRKAKVPSNSVYSYFSNSVAEQTTPVDRNKKASDISNDIGFKRDKALDSYLSALNPDSIQHENTIASSLADNYGECPVCNTELCMNETFLDCPGCGYRDCILVDSEKPSYKDPPREMSYYAYKKINHLNEWLAQFQAKETTEISQAILDQIRAELRKERITDMSKLKPSKLKEVVKKLKLNRCYDHVAHILNRLNGISAPVLSREIEEKLRFMFKEIQFSFVKHCPKKRSNFLSYSFVLYKFCELLELDDYLPCFPLLKSREKLYMQDKIWQKICEDMSWEFIRTV